MPCRLAGCANTANRPPTGHVPAYDSCRPRAAASGRASCHRTPLRQRSSIGVKRRWIVACGLRRAGEGPCSGKRRGITSGHWLTATTQQTLRGSTTQLRRKPNNPCKSNKKKTIPATFLLPMFAILSSPLRMRRLKSNRIANFLFSVDRADSAQEA